MSEMLVTPPAERHPDASGYLKQPKRTKEQAAIEIVRDYLKQRAGDPRAHLARAALAAFYELHPEAKVRK